MSDYKNRTTMMDDIFSIMGAIALVFVIVCIVLAVVSIPFALLGWAFVTVAGVFLADPGSYTYLDNTFIGIAIAIVVGVITTLGVKSNG